MSLFRKSLGEKGEIAVKKEMERRGYSLREKNFTIRGGELDLIMEKQGKIVFIEVKTRSDNSYGTPLESITPRKKEHLLHTAKVYLHSHGLDDADVSFWAGGVTLNAQGDIEEIELIADIFL